MSQTRQFVNQLVRSPKSTGAVLPSSRRLASMMLRCAGIAPGEVVAEYGPGTGSFTRPIIESLASGQKFFAVEINQGFADLLKKELPEAKVHVGCASRIAEYCRQEGVDRIDCVISGLPWANFPEDLQRKILDGMAGVMPKGGRFVTFTYIQAPYLPKGKKFRSLLGEYFSVVEKSPTVWRNFPPAFVYRCVR